MTVQDLLQAVKQLSEADKQLLLEKLQDELKTTKLKKLSLLAGRAKGVWTQDAQEFVNELRSDDRQSFS